MTAQDLIDFEADIADLFRQGKIRSPIHLSGGNEDALLAYFDEHVALGDWVLSAWRSHYHCLLHGVPAEKLRTAIREGRSMHLSFPEHHVYCSSIVGGMVPVAVGIGMAMKIHGDAGTVHCFVGDMTAETGIFHEASKYAQGKGLPVRFIIEDNGVSVATKTDDVWKLRSAILPNTTRYEYALTQPHSGIGQFVAF